MWASASWTTRPSAVRHRPFLPLSNSRSRVFQGRRWWWPPCRVRRNQGGGPPASDAPSDRPWRLGYAPGRWICETAPRTWRSAEEVRRFLDEHLVGEFAELGGRGGSGDETFGFEVRRRWEKVLAEGGWTCLGWPVEHGGRGASMTEQVIFNEEYARAAAPGPGQRHGRGAARSRRSSTTGRPPQKARFLPPIRARDGAVVPGLLRARRRQRPGQREDRAERDGDEWVVTGQKVWTSLAHQADWCFVVCRTDPGSAAPQGAVLPAGADGPARGGGAADHAAHPDQRVQRGLLRRRPHRRRQRRGRGRRRLARRPGHPGLRAGRGAARPPALASGASSTGSWPWPKENGQRRATRCSAQRLAQAHIELTIMRYNTLRSLLGRRRSGGPARGLHRQAVLGQLAPPPGRAGPERPRRRQARSSTGRRCPRTRATPWASSSAPFSSPARRPFTVGRTRSSATSSASGCSASRPSRKGRREHRAWTRPSIHRHPRHLRAATGSWTGKVVIVTAAAGTGIGSATARRCLEEGASVVVSDAHERRLAETAEQLAAETAGTARGAGARARLRRDRRGPGRAALRGGRARASAASTWPCTTPGSAAPCPWSR